MAKVPNEKAAEHFPDARALRLQALLSIWRWSVAATILLALTSATKFTKAPFGLDVGVVLDPNHVLKDNIHAWMLYLLPVISLLYSLSLAAGGRLLDEESRGGLGRLPLPGWDAVPSSERLGALLRVGFVITYLFLVPLALWGTADWFFRGDVFALNKEKVLTDGVYNHIVQGFGLPDEDYRYPVSPRGVSYYAGWQPLIYLLLVAQSYALAGNLLIRIVLPIRHRQAASFIAARWLESPTRRGLAQVRTAIAPLIGNIFRWVRGTP